MLLMFRGNILHRGHSMLLGIPPIGQSSWFMAKAFLAAGGQHFETIKKQGTLNCRGNMDSKFPTDEVLNAVKSSRLNLKLCFMNWRNFMLIHAPLRRHALITSIFIKTRNCQTVLVRSSSNKFQQYLSSSLKMW